MNSVVITKVTFYRNIKDYKFSHKLNDEQKQEIINKVAAALGEDFTFFNLNNLDAKIINYLNENSLINNSSASIFLNKKQPICVDMFNGEHISIVATGENAFEKANELADLLQNKISLAYLDEYGYICSNLNNIGAGIKLECVMCLDAICGINKLEQVKQNVAMLGYVINPTNIKSCYKVSTRCSLGFSEAEVYDNFNKTIAKLHELEVESVKMLNVSSHDEILDNVSRSYAVLNAANMINVEELTRSLIILRTGANLGIVDIDENKFNQLQKLVTNKSNYTTKEECKALAERVKLILKGEAHV